MNETKNKQGLHKNGKGSFLWITPLGTFVKVSGASKAMSLSTSTITRWCGSQKSGYYKVNLSNHLLKCCISCFQMKPKDSKHFPVEIKRGAPSMRNTCRSCRNTQDLASKTTAPYVYRFLNEAKEIVYIGKTCQLPRRLHRHFAEKPAPWKQRFTGTIEVSKLATRSDINIMEMYLISKYSPRENGKDNDGSVTTYTLPEPIFTLHQEVFNGKLRSS